MVQPIDAEFIRLPRREVVEEAVEAEACVVRGRPGGRMNVTDFTRILMEEAFIPGSRFAQVFRNPGRGPRQSPRAAAGTVRYAWEDVRGQSDPEAQANTSPRREWVYIDDYENEFGE